VLLISENKQFLSDRGRTNECQPLDVRACSLWAAHLTTWGIIQSAEACLCVAMVVVVVVVNIILHSHSSSSYHKK